ncbi:hypothetical protein BC826DRAFT_1130651 [Russula brevipes]|nr:hypothetical protein BC826DRAFT_1130651 [Russula brevipes]
MRTFSAFFVRRADHRMPSACTSRSSWATCLYCHIASEVPHLLPAAPRTRSPSRTSRRTSSQRSCSRATCRRHCTVEGRGGAQRGDVFDARSRAPLGLLRYWSSSCLCAGTRTSSPSIICRSGASLRGTGTGMGRIRLCQWAGQVGFALLQVLCALVVIEWAEELLLFLCAPMWQESKGVWARRERAEAGGRNALQTSSRAPKPAKPPPRPGPARAFMARLPGLDGFGPGPAHH